MAVCRPRVARGMAARGIATGSAQGYGGFSRKPHPARHARDKWQMVDEPKQRTTSYDTARGNAFSSLFLKFVCFFATRPLLPSTAFQQPYLGLFSYASKGARKKKSCARGLRGKRL